MVSSFIGRKITMKTIMDAVQLMEKNETSEALSLLEKKLPHVNADEKYAIAELYMEWGYIQKAEEVLLELKKEFPNESDIILLLADIYIEQEKDDQAIYLLGEIDESSEAYIQTLVQLADLYQAQGLFEVAEQKLLTAKQLDPNEPLIDFALGELLFSAGDYKKAIIHYQKILPAKELASVSIHQRLGEAYAEVGEYEEALHHFQEVDTENPDLLFKYGFTAYQADHLDIAINTWKKLLELDPYYHAAYNHLATAYMDEEMPEEAYETAKKGLEYDEFNKELYYVAATVAHKLHRNDESEQYVREAIGLDPDYKEAILFLVERLKENDNHEEIVELLTELKNTGSYDALYEWELAKAYNELEEYEKTSKHYQEAYAILYDDSDFLKEYGYFLTENGDIQAAINVLKDYLNQQPEDTEIEEFLTRLNENMS